MKHVRLIKAAKITGRVYAFIKVSRYKAIHKIERNRLNHVTCRKLITVELNIRR